MLDHPPSALPAHVYGLSKAIGVDIKQLEANLTYIKEKDLIAVDNRGISLTEKAIWAIGQNERSYCPYL